MKRLLLIANNPLLAESVERAVRSAEVEVEHVTSCRTANKLIEHGGDFDLAVVELRPCASRLALLAELHDRGLPVLPVTTTEDACEQALARAYAECEPVRPAEFNRAHLLRCLSNEMA
jgi:DNA-binding NtrC family response regulator